MKVEIKKLRDAYSNEIFAAENAVMKAVGDKDRVEARKVLSGERVLDLSDDAAMQLWESLNKVGFDVVF